MQDKRLVQAQHIVEVPADGPNIAARALPYARQIVDVVRDAVAVPRGPVAAEAMRLLRLESRVVVILAGGPDVAASHGGYLDEIVVVCADVGAGHHGPRAAVPMLG